jgi:Ion channel
MSEAQASEAPGLGLARRPGERWTRFGARIANAFGVVLLLAVTIYVLGSLVPYSGWGGVSLAGVTSACVVVALVSAGSPRGLLRWVSAFAVAGFVLAVVSALSSSKPTAGAGALIEALVLTVAAAEVLGTVISEQKVGFKTILGAISVYVILGILFTFVYAAIDRFQSGPFFGVPTQTGDFVFFSFTTLTTTGYGNLIPATHFGRMTAGLEMLVGQIFLVTLIAGLVSLWRPRTWVRRRDRER